jgi:hypothetical protein
VGRVLKHLEPGAADPFDEQPCLVVDEVHVEVSGYHERGHGDAIMIAGGLAPMFSSRDKGRGAIYIQSGLFRAVVRDGRLITGQQHYSGRKVALALIEALGI